MELLERLKEFVLPGNEKWARIFAALCLVYIVVAVVLYFLGLKDLWATTIVYYMWKSNPFGLLAGDVPYSCAPVGSRAEHWACDFDFGVRGLDLSHAEFGYGVHWYFLLFVFGGLITVRIVVLCLDRLEAVLGVDFLSRLIDKFLPGGRSTREKQD